MRYWATDLREVVEGGDIFLVDANGEVSEYHTDMLLSLIKYALDMDDELAELRE